MKKLNILKIWSFLFGVFLIQNINSQTYTWKNVNLQGMGYVTGMAIHPTSNDIYIRMDAGGAMRWDNATSSWNPITDGKIAKYNVEGLALNPSNENEVFIVCGNKEAGMLYKSSDKGATFQQLPNFSVYVAGNDNWRDNDPRLSIDPNNGGKVMFYASRISGLWKSANSGVSWSQVSASVIPFGLAAKGGQAFVVFDPTTGTATTNSSTLYLGVSGSGIYKSTNGGASFSLLTGGPNASIYNPVNCAMSPDKSIYVTYAQGWNDGLAGKVYKYNPSGVGSDITPINNNGKSFGPIDVCNTDPNKIVTFQWRMGVTNGIHYSEDGGATWSAKTCAFANFNAPAWWDKNGAINWDYTGGISFDPNNPKKIWFTSGQGVFTTSDITATNPIYNASMKGLEELVVLQVCVPTSPNPNHVLAAVADQQGFTVANRDIVPSQSWGGTQFGMGSSVDYCIANPNIVVRVSDNEQYSKPTGFIKYSDDGGNSWFDLYKPTDAASGNIALSATNSANFVWAPINSKNNGLNVRPHYSTNSGFKWTLCNGIPVKNNFCSQQWSTSKFLASDKVNGSKFYYYAWNDTIQEFYRSVNKGADFSLISTSALPGYWKVKLEAFPSVEGKLLFCSKAGSALYLSTDGGDNWSTMPNITSCICFGFGKAISPSVIPTIFIKAKVNGVDGIHFSTDNGTSWTKIYDGNIPGGLADLSGDMREEYTLYFGTGGRGVFYGTNTSSTKLNELSINNDVSIYPNPATDNIEVKLTNSIQSNVKLTIIDSVGKQLWSKNESISNNKISINLKRIHLKNGMYFLKIESGNNFVQNQKFLIRN